MPPQILQAVHVEHYVGIGKHQNIRSGTRRQQIHSMRFAVPARRHHQFQLRFIAAHDFGGPIARSIDVDQNLERGLAPAQREQIQNLRLDDAGFVVRAHANRKAPRLPRATARDANRRQGFPHDEQRQRISHEGMQSHQEADARDHKQCCGHRDYPGAAAGPAAL